MKNQVVPDTDNADVAKIAVAAAFANFRVDSMVRNTRGVHESEALGAEWAKCFKQIYKTIDETMAEARRERGCAQMVQIPGRFDRRANGA